MPDRQVGTCSLRKVDLPMAGGATGVLTVSLSCPLPLWKKHLLVLAEMGVTSTAPGWLEVNLILYEKRGGKGATLVFLVSAGSGIRRFCTASRLLLPVFDKTKRVCNVSSPVATASPSSFGVRLLSDVSKLSLKFAASSCRQKPSSLPICGEWGIPLPAQH